MSDILYIIALLLGILLSLVSATFVMIGGKIYGYIFGGCLIIAHIWAFIFSGKKANQGKSGEACIILLSPMFIISGLLSIFQGVKSTLMLVMPNSSAYTKECETAGTQYIKTPTNPAHSIAYVWDKYQPQYNYLKMGIFGVNIAYANPLYPSSILFTERGSSIKNKTKDNKITNPYIHETIDNKGYHTYKINELTADILVNYTVHLVDSEKNVTSYDLVVSDRRDAVKLATLKYVIDMNTRRVCGLTSKDEMSEREFILKAIGLQ
jgi:hypothetical protein